MLIQLNKQQKIILLQAVASGNLDTTKIRDILDEVGAAREFDYIGALQRVREKQQQGDGNGFNSG